MLLINVFPSAGKWFVGFCENPSVFVENDLDIEGPYDSQGDALVIARDFSEINGELGIITQVVITPAILC